MAGEEGFDLFGIAPAQKSKQAKDLRRWLANGAHAGMGWMERNIDMRCDPRLLMEDARSVIVLGISYSTRTPPPGIWNDPLRGRVARFAWGPDYHDVVGPMLRRLGAKLDSLLGGDIRKRVFVDTAPLLERSLACEAGLGYPGFNSNIISGDFGSYILLGEILTTAELEPTPAAESIAAECDLCRRCIESCPTTALTAPYTCDSRRCISYLTIENRGDIPPDLRPLMGNWIFGCDACQECCPHLERIAPVDGRNFVKYDPDIAAPPLLELMELDEAGFRTRFRKTAIYRSKRRGLLRNAAVALGNSRRPEALPALERAMDDEEEIVRRHAAWALAEIRRGTIPN